MTDNDSQDWEGLKPPSHFDNFGEGGGLDVIAWAIKEGLPVPKIDWLVEQKIKRGTVTIIAGAAGIGKTAVAIDLALSVSLGQPFLGIPTQQAKVLLLAAEDDSDEIWRRVEPNMRRRGQPLSALDANFAAASMVGKDMTLVRFDPSGEFEYGPFWDTFNGALGHFYPYNGLVILDNSVAVFDGNENDRQPVYRFLNLTLLPIALKYNCSIVLLQHPSRAGLANGDGYVGSTAWEGAVRSRLYLKRAAGDDPNNRDKRILSTVKSNYSALGDDINLRWEDGVFVREGSPPVLDRIDGRVRGRSAEDAFLAGLASWNAAERRPLSDSKNGNYAPKLLHEARYCEGFTAAELVAAMDRLFKAKRIAPRPLRKSLTDRHMVIGLAEIPVEASDEDGEQ